MRTNSCTQEQCFSVRTALALFILSFTAPVPPSMAPWPHLWNIMNRPCLGHTESLAFHTDAAQLSSRFWAWQHSCHSNQNKRFILQDLARQMFPWAKQRGVPPSPDIPQLQIHNERKIQWEPAYDIKARTSQVHGDGGSWRMKGPQTPQYKSTSARNTAVITTKKKRIKVLKKTVSFLDLTEVCLHLYFSST